MVDDGSMDETAEVCRQYGVRVVAHPYSLGNGAAVKAGARAASGEILVFMDADGQHDPADIARLVAKLEEGYVMAGRREGKSHIQPVQDGVRFLLIIFKIATLYSPLKLFVPASVVFFLLGLGNYLHTYLTVHRLTNMSVLLFSASVIVFLIGLVSEQITALTYRRDA